MSRPLDLSSLSKLSSSLRAMPKRLGIEVAKRAAPVISQFAKDSFDGSRDPYGVPWVPGAHGQTVKLRETGALERFIRYVAVGTKLRVSLGVPYAKYQIGKRPVYPRAGLLPVAYSRALERVVVDTAKEFVAARTA